MVELCVSQRDWPSWETDLEPKVIMCVETYGEEDWVLEALIKGKLHTQRKESYLGIKAARNISKD